MKALYISLVSKSLFILKLYCISGFSVADLG